MPQAKVAIDQVRKVFQTGARSGQTSVTALDGVSLEVAPTEIVALAGASGCGKTTLLRIVMGLDPPTSGEVRVDGQTVRRPGHDRGMVFQHAELLPWRDALGNVEFGLELKGVGRAERREIARRHLELVGLADASDRRPDQLSGGMRQRVGMARALAIGPEVLLLDEPFGALDALTREHLQAELLQIHETTRKTILFVTHDLDEAVLLADRVAVMGANPGRIVEVVDVGLPRPRPGVEEVRSSQRFVEVRAHTWRVLKAAIGDQPTDSVAGQAEAGLSRG